MINWNRINMFLFNGFIFIAIVGGLCFIAYFDSKCKEEKRIKDQAEYNRQFSGCRNINVVFNRETGKLEYDADVFEKISDIYIVFGTIAYKISLSDNASNTLSTLLYELVYPHFLHRCFIIKLEFLMFL